jgi:aryl sulfotransferase
VRSVLEAQQHRRFIKTHTPLDGIPFDERVTYIGVGRDPRDVAMSWDNHAANMNIDVVLAARATAGNADDIAEILVDGPPPVVDDPVERFWAWVDADLTPLGGRPCLAATLHHLDTCWARRHRDNVALFHFADMESDLDAEMRRLAEVLHIPVRDETWPSLVSAATFDNMRARADELAPQVMVADFWHDTSRFFHRGGSGQWRTIVSEEGMPRYDARVRQLAPPDLARWAHLGWRCVGGPN